jgi:hypothetical protein
MLIRITAFVSLVAVVMTAACEAQFVGWGPFGGVRVRAPFVSVNVSPYGAVGVRAPFTSVYAPGYGPVVSYRRAVVGVPAFPPVPPFVVPPVAVVPVVPVPAFQVVPEITYAQPSIPAEGYQVTRPSLDGHVSEDLHRAAIKLQYSLSQRYDGDVWLDYLAPGRIINSIEKGDPPSSLRDLVTNYDGVVANSSLRPIYRAGGFDETRELLRVYVDLPATALKSAPSAATKTAPVPRSPAPPSPRPPQAADGSIEDGQAEELPAPAGQDQDQEAPQPPDPIPPKVSRLEPIDV